MIDSDIVVGAGLRITASKEDLVSRLAVVSRGVSTRTAVSCSEAFSFARRTVACISRRPTWRFRFDRHSKRRWAARERSSSPGGSSSTSHAPLPENEVSIEHKPEEAVVIVTSGTALYRLHTYSAEDFPRLPEIDDTAMHAIDRDALVDTVSRVGRSASRDESRPVLTGILVRFEPGKVVMAATDSYRLAVKETAVSNPLPELDAIMPARALQEVTRIAAGADEVQLGLQENHVFFGADGTWLTTRRIDGQFPNYRQLLPEQFEHEVVLPREELLDVVRRVSLMAQRNSPLRLRFAEGELTVSASHTGHRRGPRVAPGPVHGRRARDRVQRGVPAGRPGVGRFGIDPVEADQPAAPGSSRGRGRRLRVPDHADSSRRVRPQPDSRAPSASPVPVIASLDLALAPGLVLVTGRNGAGKTNLLESLHVATQGFSPRTRRDAELIQFGESAARAEVRGRRGATEVDVSGRSDGAAEGGEAERRPAGVGRVAAPRALDARVHTGSAGGRQGRARRAPRVLRPRARTSPTGPRRAAPGVPGHTRSAECRVTAGAARAFDDGSLAPWTERLVSLGAGLAAARVAALGRARARLRSAGRGAAPRSATLDVPRRAADSPTLEARLPRDVERGTTGLGPTWTMWRSRRTPRPAPVRLARRAAARGARTAARRGGAPSGTAPPLLDDVLSELDPGRRGRWRPVSPASGRR